MPQAGKSPARRVSLLIATRKGLWQLHGDTTRRTWRLAGPQFLGHVVHHCVADPRDTKTMLAAARTGHLGPTIFRSSDRGRSWHEAKQPPAFSEGSARVVDHTFWLTPGHASEPGVWYGGTSPQGLFRSEDGGATWRGVAGFNEHPQRKAWCGGDQDGTPDGPKLHSILIDPRDARHMYIGMSSGGVFESTDGGADWRPLNRGVKADFLPQPDPEYGHDPHCVRLHPALPDRLYQQNHCGIYRLDRPAERWEDIGAAMPKSVGPIGLPMVVHPREPDTIWVFPMDGTSVWPRVSPGGKPAVYRSVNAGKSWQRQAIGLPKSQAWLTVKRQAMSADAGAPVGVYFGTTSGEVWGSRDEGRTWKCLASHLPEIYSVETMQGGDEAICPTTMRVLVPGPLRSYTNDAPTVSADGTTLAEVVGDLELRYPGIRFRIIDEQGSIRQHIKFFVNGVQARDLSPRIAGNDEVMIVCALTGG